MTTKSPTPRRRGPATCHPAKPNFGRGLCSTCYFRDRREKVAVLTGKAKPLRGVLEAAALVTPRDLAHAVELAQDELIAALPEAARALRKIIVEGDPDKGLSIKAAVAVLRGVSVPGGRAGLRRLLEGPAKPDAGPPAAQVVIGLHLAAGDVQVGRVVGTIGPVHGEQ